MTVQDMQDERGDHDELGESERIHGGAKANEALDFEVAYEEARKAFERGELREASERAEQLLQRVIIAIIDSNYRRLSQSKPFGNRMAELTPEGEDKDLESIPLRDLCSLLDDDEIGLFALAKGGYEKYATLLGSIRFERLADLAFYSHDNTKGKDAKLAIQQLLCAITALLLAHTDIEVTPYHLLANFTDMTREIEKIRSSSTKLATLESELSYLKPERAEKSQRSFVWFKFRGMLINQHDGSRNIAFKVETFVNMLMTIYKGIVTALIEAKKDTRVAESLAESIVLEAGYRSGSRFGWTMHELFQKESRPLTLSEKVRKWCAFDSDVGFGMLDLGSDISAEEKAQDGHRYEDLAFAIKLSDNFLVFKQGTEDQNLCCFMQGYIQGVLEKITGQPLIVTHSSTACEQFIPEQNYCVFDVKTDTEKLVAALSHIQKRYSRNIERLESLTGLSDAFLPEDEAERQKDEK